MFANCNIYGQMLQAWLTVGVWTVSQGATVAQATASSAWTMSALDEDSMTLLCQSVADTRCHTVIMGLQLVPFICSR